MQRLENILERIRTLAPGSAEHLVAQSYYTYYILKDYGRAFELVERARALAPGDLQVLELRSWIERRLGDFHGVVATLRQVRKLDPRNEYWVARLVNGLVMLHRYDEAVEELRNASVSSLRLEAMHSLLRISEHRDIARRLVELERLEREYGVEAAPLRRWEAYIAARNFAGARSLIDAFDASGRPRADWGALALPDQTLSRVITHWFQHGADPGDADLIAMRRSLERVGVAAFDGPEGVGGFEPNVHLAMAIASAAEGNRAEATRLIRTWFREAPTDQAEFVNQRHYACRVLGMAGAAVAAMDCIRSGLQNPSWVMPFIEPFLPYYDPIRDDARFVEWLAGLEGSDPASGY
jgi:Flp pilus assembly protein TadD